MNKIEQTVTMTLAVLRDKGLVDFDTMTERRKEILADVNKLMDTLDAMSVNRDDTQS